MLLVGSRTTDVDIWSMPWRCNAVAVPYVCLGFVFVQGTNMFAMWTRLGWIHATWHIEIPKFVVSLMGRGCMCIITPLQQPPQLLAWCWSLSWTVVACRVACIV